MSNSCWYAHTKRDKYSSPNRSESESQQSEEDYEMAKLIKWANEGSDCITSNEDSMSPIRNEISSESKELREKNPLEDEIADSHNSDLE